LKPHESEAPVLRGGRVAIGLLPVGLPAGPLFQDRERLFSLEKMV